MDEKENNDFEKTDDVSLEKKKKKLLSDKYFIFLLLVIVFLIVVYAKKNYFFNNKSPKKTEINYSEENGDIMVSVNDKDITSKEYKEKLKEYMLTYENAYGSSIWEQEIESGTTYKEFIEEMVMDSMILEIVLLEEAKKEKISVSDNEINSRYEEYKGYFQSEDDYNKYLQELGYDKEKMLESIEKDLTIEKFTKKKSEEIDKLTPTENELKDVYNTYPELFNKVNASHILFDDKDKADIVKNRIDAGELFDEIGKEEGTMAQNLGYFLYGDMVEDFSKVAFSLNKNQISEVIKTIHGYHIIKVIDKKDSYDKINREELEFKYKTIKYNKLLDNFIENAKIEWRN